MKRNSLLVFGILVYWTICSCVARYIDNGEEFVAEDSLDVRFHVFYIEQLYSRCLNLCSF